jgi:hypothetical protein
MFKVIELNFITLSFFVYFVSGLVPLSTRIQTSRHYVSLQNDVRIIFPEGSASPWVDNQNIPILGAWRAVFSELSSYPIIEQNSTASLDIPDAPLSTRRTFLSDAAQAPSHDNSISMLKCTPRSERASRLISSSPVTLGKINKGGPADDELTLSPPPPPTLVVYLYGVIDVSPFHEEKIDALWKDFKKRRYLESFSPTEYAQVFEALKIAYVAFYGMKTPRSLELCLDRARGTAMVLGEIKVDPATVIASILHELFDYIPEKDHAISKTLLKSRIGSNAVTLIEKYHRLPKLVAQKAMYTPEQSENHIQMLVVMCEDYRTLYVRLAQRLNCMRNLGTLNIDYSEKIKIAQEALNVYAPLAHKMNLIKVKGELEDLAFR